MNIFLIRKSKSINYNNDMKLKNTFTNNKEDIVFNKDVIIYLCGPTVYNKVHLGNIRPVIVTDLLINILKQLGHDVKFIHNITDINEKIIKYGNSNNKSEKEVAELFSNKYIDLLKKICCNYPNKIMKVTESMKIINDYINDLFVNEYAYIINNDGVYINILLDKEYGSLSNRNINEQKDILINNNKKNQNDFCVWKMGIKGDQFPSKFGAGRPGWHTECVAMIDNINNKKEIDFHIGGTDLIFPHHENEICQQRLLRKNNLSKYWLHVGQLNFEGNKMAKSIGNVIDAQDFIDEYNISTVKYIMHSNNYTKPLNLTSDFIKDAHKKSKRFCHVYKEIKKYNITKNISSMYFDILLNNMNTPVIIATLNKMTKKINSYLKENNFSEIKKIADDYCNLIKMLGLCY